jgi:hypothetical protein
MTRVTTYVPSAGVDARPSMALLGHADISTTMNIYTHVLPALAGTPRPACPQCSSRPWLPAWLASHPGVAQRDQLI